MQLLNKLSCVDELRVYMLSDTKIYCILIAGSEILERRKNENFARGRGGGYKREKSTLMKRYLMNCAHQKILETLKHQISRSDTLSTTS